MGIGVYGKMDRALARIGPYPDRGLWSWVAHQGPMPPRAYRYSHRGLCIGVYDRSGEGSMYRTL